MNPLITIFNSILPISEEEQTFMKQHLFTETLKKGEKYCEQGKICTKIGFVIEGVFKVMKVDTEGNEYIPYFTSEGHFAVAMESFSDKTPSDESVVAVTDCTVVTITSSAFHLFEREIVNFSKIIHLLKEKAFIEKFKLKSEMLVDDAETKYTKLLLRQPSIIQRVPQNQIALFLGITPHTLSRIRAKI
ncbi:Crp/Fnr family transcriptional regulator [Flavobacterium fluviatile]|uniref:Crp/Fnr family transcriptional regulator n=1 Tax=Flavobacterium fluviatile TaxID=1862387 RepID=UPI0013D6A6CE|nr:Crp/Fnr family transcriptional regulator [Flavobacterium fluviatile]